MANRIVGVDSLSPVTEALVAATVDALGATPAFWGRYFTSRSTPGTGEFRHRVEGGVLRDHGIRVLPIARQTNRVSGTRTDGQIDGRKNADDLLATFGDALLASMGASVHIFLDVEGDVHSRLSQDYYEGWAEGLTQASSEIAVQPCVYGIPSDATTWSALSRAVSAGASCGGIWLSHPHGAASEPVAWDATMLRPFPGIAGAPVLLWQYLFGATFDRNLVNPDLADPDAFIESLVLPPAAAVGAFA